jgi:hypothetical protein
MRGRCARSVSEKKEDFLHDSDRIFDRMNRREKAEKARKRKSHAKPLSGSGESEGTEDVSPPKKWFLQFVFAFLFLVIGMIIFFVGGVVVRNPQLPSYLLDQNVTRFRGETGKTANSVTPRNYVSSAESLNCHPAAPLPGRPD